MNGEFAVAESVLEKVGVLLIKRRSKTEFQFWFLSKNNKRLTQGQIRWVLIDDS